MAKEQKILDAVQEYGKRLFAFIRSRVQSHEDAEDILQDVWYYFSAAMDLEPISQISAWLYRASRNRIIDKQRKHEPQLIDNLAYENEDGEFYNPGSLLSDENTPESELEQQYIMEQMLEALQELPDKQRDVFIWNELEDFTLQQIADKTGDNIKTIISRKRYAVAHLRNRLENLYKE